MRASFNSETGVSNTSAKAGGRPRRRRRFGKAGGRSAVCILRKTSESLAVTGYITVGADVNHAGNTWATEEAGLERVSG